MPTRRAFLGRFATGGAAAAVFRDGGLDTVLAAGRAALIVVPVLHEEFQGLRVTPNVYTTLQEVDTFAEEMEREIAGGLPA